MATIDEHEKDCKNFIGQKFSKVHEFLDSYAINFPIQIFYDYHRTFLHNSYGLAIVCSRWGKQALKAAQIHLVRDYMHGPLLTLKDVESNLGRCLLYFNGLQYFELNLQSHIIKSWGNKGLVAVMKGDM